MKEVHEMLLEEFDPERRAVINPDQVVKPVESTHKTYMVPLKDFPK